MLNRCIEELGRLIAHSTVNPGGDEIGLCSSLAKQLRSLGADSVHCQEVPRPGKAGAYVYAQFGKPELLLNVHIDTVPENNSWTRDPFVASREGERIYGLGSCDIKGAIAALLAAAEVSPLKNLGILFSGDEERDSECMQFFLNKEDTRSLRHAIVCEPSSKKAGIAHRGIHRYMASFSGQGGHSSKADHLPKPIVELSRLAIALDNLSQRYLHTGPSGMQGLCMNVALMRGGVAYNVVPDSATLDFSLRPAHSLDIEAIEKEIHSLASNCHPEIEIEKQSGLPAFACSDIDGLKKLLGQAPSEFVSLDYWTEAALLDKAGIASVVIGPGDIAQAHTSDEFVSLGDLSWACDMFAKVLERHAA